MSLRTVLRSREPRLIGPRPRSIYAFDIVKRNGAVFLANRRMFALARRGAPMHLMCEDGNVWAACGDGVEIWNSGGSLLGVIQVPGELLIVIPSSVLLPI